MLCLKDPTKIKPRDREVLVKMIETKTTEGGLHIPQSAQSDGEAPFPFCRVLCVGPGVPEDVKVGDVVGVARPYWNMGFFSFDGESYSLTGEDGIVCHADEAVAESKVIEAVAPVIKLV